MRALAALLAVAAVLAATVLCASARSEPTLHDFSCTQCRAVAAHLTSGRCEARCAAGLVPDDVAPACERFCEHMIHYLVGPYEPCVSAGFCEHESTLRVATADAPRQRPVVMMHGVTADKHSLDNVVAWITEIYPDLYIYNAEVGNGKLDSVFWDLDKQVDDFAASIRRNPNLKDGFNLIGFSMGTLITRAYVERYNDPPVYNLISWAGPQAGQFGTPFVNIPWVDDILALVAYENWAQKALSPANFWKDPHLLSKYNKYVHFLTDINNEHTTKNAQYKERISSLNTLVLLYSIKDEVIKPRESGWFYFYKDGTIKELVPLHESQQYAEDWIGLKTLDERGALVMQQTDCLHSEHPKDICKVYFDQHTVPYLNNTLPAF